MRKFLSAKAGATFNTSSPNFTVAVRKDEIELIIKADKGCYAIINMLPVKEGEVLFFANWGNYFTYLKNMAVQMPRIEKTCPALYKLLSGDYKGVMEIDMNHLGLTGMGFMVETQAKTLTTTVDDDVAKFAFELYDAARDIIREIDKNPPFPAWKDRLKDLWE